MFWKTANMSIFHFNKTHSCDNAIKQRYKMDLRLNISTCDPRHIILTENEG